MSKIIDNHEDLIEYIIAKKVWDDIHNNDALTYDNFNEYFFNEIYLPMANKLKYTDYLNDEMKEWENLNQNKDDNN